MDIALKTGQRISITLYDGDKREEALFLQGCLVELMGRKSPIKINFSDFNLMIEDVAVDLWTEPLKHVTMYRVIVKGVLV